MKKPKLLKFPKQPKASAGVDVWERYYKRCEEINKRNKEKLKPYLEHSRKKKAITEKVRKFKLANKG